MAALAELPLMKIFNLTLLLATSASLADAAILARWTPVSVASDPVVGDAYSSAANTPAADEVSPLLTASGLARNGFPDAFANAGAVFPGRAADGLTPDGAGGFLTNLEIYTNFTLTPAPGASMSLGEITYNYQSYGQTSTGGYLVSLRTSLDGFASEVASATILDSDPTGGLVTLDASSLTGLTAATEFRIYAGSPVETGGNRWFDLSGSDSDPGFGLIVNGEAIPEPSSTFLGGIALLALAARRRR